MGSAHNASLDEQTRSILVPHIGRQGTLVDALHDVQQAFGYLPEQALRVLADELKVSLAQVWGVASFYDRFYSEPRGRNVVRVCTGTACQVRGSQSVLQRLEKAMGLKNGETTADRAFTLETVNCVGCCGLAPVVVVNNEVVPNRDVERVIRDLPRESGDDE
ncbi:MAG: NAD(P)H-dependent oxidoreductase subunit E [Bacillota bacterium]